MKNMHHILIVDDDADDREIIRDAFVQVSNHYEFSFHENGDVLIHNLQCQAPERSPSLILLDLNMPGKDGRETLRELKSDQRYRHIPIVIFTTSSSQRDRVMAYELGANCFVTKPDTFDKLTELARCLASLWLT